MPTDLITEKDLGYHLDENGVEVDILGRTRKYNKVMDKVFICMLGAFFLSIILLLITFA